jgi:hypothetical protein
MRTTLTLDDDVAALLKETAKEGKSFKRTVNEALRAGLTVLAAKRPAKRSRYRLQPVSLGKPRLPDLDNIAEVLAVAEGERHP